MDLEAPPTLLQLAAQSTVKKEVLTISVLEYLPRELFPTLFKEADTQRKAKMIKILVEYWPYPCLLVRLLIDKPNLEIFQAILDGVGTWLKRKYRPRMGKLEVVDLRNGHLDSWDMQAGREGGGAQSETVLEKQVMEGHSNRRRLRVFCDLSFKSSKHEDKHQTHLLRWAKDREDFLHLCCKKLEIGALEVSKVKKELKFLQPEFIKELELNTVGNLSKLAKLVPCISKMRNLHKLMLVRIFERTYTPSEKNVSKIISLFPELRYLQNLTIGDVYFLKDHMNELLRCLVAPLVSLTITLCQISQSDLESFAQRWNYGQLKHLCLKGVSLTALNVTPLKCFLESVANTLQTLELEGCRMSDSHLSILQPALTQCTQLTSFNFYDNNISMDALKDLLRHTVKLSQLTMELYPAPVEVYNEWGYVQVETFSQLCAELMDTLVAVRQPKSICFGTYSCYDCDTRCIYEKNATFCECLE
ncbi:preferentially expressed antigen in melanoma-like protein 7 [Rattus rattus]|uniref:preferentially expressed antigen in melanoma-like protein 7 n=1 Tax=Rattus rattus TaxID=10117 RepID=UPI0013F2B690|nr:preferentially expressed antigen in melanoma-like protein 7 [Rattus rattus]